MDFLTDWIDEWAKSLLIDGIMSDLNGLFKNVNDQIGETAAQVGATSGGWDPGVFSLIRRPSETVVLSTAGLILTFVMYYELTQMLINRNNLYNIDTWVFFKWVFKTFTAVLFLSNIFNIVMAVLSISQSIINNAGGMTAGNTAVSSSMVDSLKVQLMTMGIGPLLDLWMQSSLIEITIVTTNIIVFVIVYGRMIEIYPLISLAPVPMAALASREVGSMSQNYLKSLCAVGSQGSLISVCVGICTKPVQSIAVGDDPIGAIWTVIGCTTLLCFTMFKVGSLVRPIFGVH